MAKTKKSESALFVLVEKDGAQIEVHPDALENHKQLGWVEVQKTSVVKPEPEAEPETDPDD